MRKLMSANLSRLWKDKVFWLATALVLGYSIVSMLSGCRQATRDMSEYQYALDHYYFAGMPAIGAFIAMVISLFIGIEHGEGVIRNKLIVGHTRTAVYMANLLTSCIASLIMLGAWLLGGFVGIPVLGIWQVGAISVLCYILISVLMIGALCTVFTLASMLMTNKALNVVLCIVLWFGMTIIGSMAYNALSEPEMITGYTITTETGLQMSDPTPNPNYLSGAIREVYEYIADFMPVSQGIRLAYLEVINPLRMMLSSVFIMTATTWSGIFIFRRKNLK